MEEVISTPAHIKYNNLLWHKVQLIKVGSQVDIQVNDENLVSTSLTAQDLFLDIDLGVFLGGYGKHHRYHFVILINISDGAVSR